ncbi:hypothetical protein BJ878DRAFT_544573 [Calycina marina]|uniref:BTB domain-containing protein n=1 Tax=Calycina marina TaxID=1763456 RepID=A0A9P7YYL8_9HELO|nr:hypothetical protein BJ878DRAFT_544573 [Calycina marina]
MSNLLWKYYLEDDAEGFCRRLELAGHPHPSKAGAGHTSNFGSGGSPSLATSPKSNMKNRKPSGQMGSLGAKGGSESVGRAEINMKDHAGLTILHRAVSSTAPNAIKFALALIEHPMIDLYIQDLESGWTALHRALYFGNITMARAIMQRDRRDAAGSGASVVKAGASVIRVKDHEGNSPLDVYNATIARRSLQQMKDFSDSEDASEEAEDVLFESRSASNHGHGGIGSDELFVFGSNKNHSLGFGDGDDRQHPERITLKRPDHLFFRFYQEYLETTSDRARSRAKSSPRSLEDLPSLVLNRPIVVHDVVLSKLSSAILTTDPVANLYMCGFGPGGRLGTGDEVTRLTYTCVEEGGLAGERIEAVALGQNHTLAVTSRGQIFSWGTSTYGQLGYNLPRSVLQDEEPFCATPRQIFGPLKRESIMGVAASAIHSVAYTSTALYCWGKNEGQLGLIDSDSRSLFAQLTPRRVAASLFKAPIKLVSAINGATICLLANHTVCVFTNYGYNIVKYPLYDNFNNKSILTTRYNEGPNHISFITAGGDTIAAISSRGDLFTLNVRKMDSEEPEASTTNPSKIKSSLSVPQKVWSLRKGHWDGIKSVGVGENGSVIVCTHGGAVWRQIRRANAKSAFADSGSLTRKDFKYQRVPGLTNIAAVCSTPFGVYAAVRKDCDVTKSQIHIEPQNLWDDIGSLLCVRNLVVKDLPGSTNVESDVQDILRSCNADDYDTEVRCSTSEVRLPAHGFMLAGRSSVIRSALQNFRQNGSASLADILTVVSIEPDTIGGDSRPTVCITFQGLNFLSVLNFMLYVYTDKVIDFWHYARQYPNMAFRYRQVRVEIMKTASHLNMIKLESAVRLMNTKPERCMDKDMDIAILDAAIFEDGDTLLELDGENILCHSSLLRKRCPFFEGLFNGRSGGQWLAGRRVTNDRAIPVDLKHMDPAAFKVVLRYLYADVGSELFDDVVSTDVDDFFELVLQVMDIADELMLDRLSQTCQQVVGRFVGTRNVSRLLNLIAPCSVSQFKSAALEYICLQLESMLENHLVDDLDDELMLELDEIVRGNQLNCLPFAKSGRAELLLHERYPTLAEDVDEERKRRVRDLAFRTSLKEDDSRLCSSFRAHSIEDTMSSSPSQDKLRRKSKTPRNAPFSPSIRPKESSTDLMFDMDDEDTLAAAGPSRTISKSNSASKLTPRTPSASWPPEILGDEVSVSPARNIPPVVSKKGNSPLSARQWSSPALSSAKLDMREIMAQASSSKVSNLSISLAAQSVEDHAAIKASNKLSQKERRKKQQQEAISMSTSLQITLDKPDGKPSSPWQVAATGQKMSLKDIFNNTASSPIATASNKLESPSPSRAHKPRRAASPDTRFAGQKRSMSSQTNIQPPARSSPLIPHSKSYNTPPGKAETSLQLSISDIIVQQRREQEIIKEASAKRSLQEIQEEQAFQEWWDQESKRAQEEEAARAIAATSTGRSGKSARGKGASRGRGGRGRGESSRGGRGRVQENLPKYYHISIEDFMGMVIERFNYALRSSREELGHAIPHDNWATGCIQDLSPLEPWLFVDMLRAMENGGSPQESGTCSRSAAKGWIQHMIPALIPSVGQLCQNGPALAPIAERDTGNIYVPSIHGSYINWNAMDGPIVSQALAAAAARELPTTVEPLGVTARDPARCKRKQGEEDEEEAEDGIVKLSEGQATWERSVLRRVARFQEFARREQTNALKRLENPDAEDETPEQVQEQFIRPSNIPEDSGLENQADQVNEPQFTPSSPSGDHISEQQSRYQGQQSLFHPNLLTRSGHRITNVDNTNSLAHRALREILRLGKCLSAKNKSKHPVPEGSGLRDNTQALLKAIEVQGCRLIFKSPGNSRLAYIQIRPAAELSLLLAQNKFAVDVLAAALELAWKRMFSHL